MGKLEGMFSPFWHCYTQSFLKSDPSSLPRNTSVIQTPPRFGAGSVMEMARGFLISRSLTALRTTFFGGDLDNPLAEGAFRYTKGGKSYLSSKDDAVAKKWRELLATRHDQTSRVVLVEFCQLRNHPPSERPRFFFLFFFALHT
jgi:hypothetical protein